MYWWPEPTAGDIVWCHFPATLTEPAAGSRTPPKPGQKSWPRPKPRPGLVLLTKEDDLGHLFVSVAYGTSQKTSRLFRGEFLLSKFQHPAAYAAAGLSYDTKVDLGKALLLPFNDDYFAVPPHAPHGQIPKLGTLHPSMVRIAAAAYAAVRG